MGTFSPEAATKGEAASTAATAGHTVRRPRAARARLAGGPKGESWLMSPRFHAAGFVAFLSLAAAHADAPVADAPGSPAPVRMGGGAKPTGVCRLAFAPDGMTVAWAGSGPVRL